LKDMSLANILITKRREKGVTQDEFAAHVRVSKGSVSKWDACVKCRLTKI